jgi:predicted metal-dependent peptidase
MINLLYNSNFLSALNIEQIKYVLIHEIYHLLFKHIFKPIPKGEERKIFNIAADLSVNSFIDVSNKEVEYPKDKDGNNLPLLPSKYGFPPELSIENYIVMLRKIQDNQSNQGGQGGQGSSGSQSNQDDQDNYIDEHINWGEIDDYAQQYVDAMIEAAMKRNIWGNIPGQAKVLIEAGLKSKVKWIKKLNFFVQGIIKSHSKRFSVKALNRRYGFLYPGTVKEYVNKVLVAVDTSASIEDKDLSQFIAEINKINEYVPVEVIQFDTELKGKPISWKKRKKSFDFEGRGGTSYEPVMNYVESNKIPYLIILTDGMASPVDKPKYLKKCLWVLVGNEDPPVSWGEIIRIET